MYISIKALCKGAAGTGPTLTSTGVATDYSIKSSNLNKEFKEKDEVINENQEFENELKKLMKKEKVPHASLMGSIRDRYCKHGESSSRHANLPDKKKMVKCAEAGVGLTKLLNDEGKSTGNKYMSLMQNK